MNHKKTKIEKFYKEKSFTHKDGRTFLITAVVDYVPEERAVGILNGYAMLLATQASCIYDSNGEDLFIIFDSGEIQNESDELVGTLSPSIEDELYQEILKSHQEDEYEYSDFEHLGP
jgi:hypothetical protein